MKKSLNSITGAKQPTNIQNQQPGQYEFQQTKDRYFGQIDPVTKLRNGEGIYTYENAFFQYKGQWLNGVKHGYGILIMKDGTYYEGEFNQGEINGKGERRYTDGSIYKGEFRQGEKDGYGELQYIKTGEWYKGNWVLNVRQGQGTYFTKDRNTYTGEFRDNWPNGMCMIQFNNGSLYQGQVVKGIMQGKGQLTQLDKTVYEGYFENNKREGMGRFYVMGSTYTLVSNYKDNKPEFEANQILFKLIKKEEEEEQKIDPKAKGKPDPKAQLKKGGQAEEDKEEEGKNKIVYEVGKENNFIEFELHIVYQGPPFEDPNPPPIEEDPKKLAAAAKNAKGAKGQPAQPDEPEPKRMITPDPLVMVNENGRNFEFELGRFEKVRKVPLLEGEVPPAGEPNPDDFEDKWATYKFNQKKESLKDQIQSKEGILSVKDLSYTLNESFRGGTYEITIRDVTRGITNKMPDVKVELLIIDPEEILAQQQAAALAKNPPKKK
eukprot:403349752